MAPSNPVSGPLRRRINLLAHAAGQAHAEALKARLLARIAALRAANASFDEQLAAIDAETQLITPPPEQPTSESDMTTTGNLHTFAARAEP